MEYTTDKLAEISGVSARTLRYYDQLGLLSPARAENGYRIYGKSEVDALQQILFYRELGVPLSGIKQLIGSPDYDREKALLYHLDALLDRKAQIERLIVNVRRTIGAMKGETEMCDAEKFEGFKQKMINVNEAEYGEEARRKYGEDVVDASVSKVKSMSEAQWKRAQELSGMIEKTLGQAFAEGDPSGVNAREACRLHKEWLCMFWGDGAYSKQAHAALAETYVSDGRFREYYDRIGQGCAEFFRDAIKSYCGAR